MYGTLMEIMSLYWLIMEMKKFGFMEIEMVICIKLTELMDNLDMEKKYLR